MKNSTLQNFTKIERKVHRLLAKNPIPRNQFEKLTREEKKVFSDVINEKIRTLQYEERDQFLEKLESQLNFYPQQEFKFTIWESNHFLISETIENYITTYGRYPTKTHLQAMTGLSRPTINEHLKKLSTSDHYKKYTEQFKMMTDRVLGAMTKSAIEGNVSAQRLFLQFISGEFGKRVNTQNNYIQINGMIITEEKLKTLPMEQLKAIENILSHSTDVFQNNAVEEEKQ